MYKFSKAPGAFPFIKSSWCYLQCFGNHFSKWQAKYRDSLTFQRKCQGFQEKNFQKISMDFARLQNRDFTPIFRGRGV
nr:MAG TPA: hypothetical protein [Bacteriophage sp.]